MEDNTNKPFFPCIWQAVILSICILVIQFFSGIVGAIPGAIVLHTTKDNILSNAITYTISDIVQIVIFTLAALLICKFFIKKSFSSLFALPKNISFILIIATIMVVLGNSVISSEIDNITRYFIPMPRFIDEIFKSLFKEPISAFLTVCITAALCEELIFRGIIVRGFMSHYSMRKTMIVSAIFFALIHINPFQFANAFIMGLFFAYLFIKTESLWLPIAAHFLSNLLAWGCATGIFPLKVRGYSVVEEKAFQPLWFDLTGALLLSAGLFLTYYLLKPKELDSEPPAIDTEQILT